MITNQNIKHMKKILFPLFLLTALVSLGQTETDFKKEITTAKKSYSANKLEETHFALQQALSEIDITIGKEILKMLPAKMGDATINTKEDHVTSNLGMVGATVSRSYGTPNEKVKFELISNSPLVSTLNALLNNPMVGGMMRDENSKTIKVQGYKARMERQAGEAEGEFNYTIQLPFGNALLTFTVFKTTESEATKLMESLPLQAIAKLVQ